MKKSGYLTFLRKMRNITIRDNLERLNFYSDEIKRQCINLNIEQLYYEKLPAITNEEDLGSWIAFGRSMENKAIFNKLERNNYSRELAYNYLKIAKIVGHKEFEDTATRLEKLIINKKN